jgi:Leucine-rich repeat (LRR) protein
LGLTYIPSSIGKLKNLEKLMIKGNKIKNLPKELFNLTN